MAENFSILTSRFTGNERDNFNGITNVNNSQNLETSSEVAPDEIIQDVERRKNNNNNNDEEIQEKNSFTNIIMNYCEKWKFVFSVPNKGTVARDHLANERTVLAWARTSLSFVAVGVGIVQLFNLSAEDGSSYIMYKTKNISSFGKPLGICFVTIAVLCTLFGFIRYFLVQKLLEDNRFPIDRLSIIVLLFSLLTMTIVVLAVVAKV
ncbi:hypothetical protein PACTADRAFT_769 [Pachysolen tannophilus NRRL Y-2460]|uniref:DUF202 domain-containing protein n=1 Tax=Pachysolen tannophilus NRRL Y-2460 TaxID=669874 RepID=A0A1E4U2P9_PACTA|nr:hypothetical protein PACTADRAFT_769 [Pachysolen tannophilus NRRL Y-2460]